MVGAGLIIMVISGGLVFCGAGGLGRQMRCSGVSNEGEPERDGDW